ncbi:MAG: S8 family serine peptidase [Candidatus Aenigmatarchaeota archaeon]
MGLTPVSYSIIFACVAIVAVFAVSSVYDNPAGLFRGVGIVQPIQPSTSPEHVEPVCVPSEEICDGEDNDCDELIDEDEVCDSQGPEFNGYIVQLKEDPVSVYYLEQKNTLTKTTLKTSVNNYRANLIQKQNEIKNTIPKSNIKSSYQNVFNGFEVLDITEEEAKYLESLPEVKKVYKNYKVYTYLMDSVPLINADDVWSLQVNGTNLTGEDITIGVIDTGVDYTHEDLGDCTTEQFLIGDCGKVVGGWDFGDNDPDPIDFQGHGTHVAAIAAGNGILDGSAPGADIYALKVFHRTSDSKEAFYSAAISAIDWATDPNQDGDFYDHLDILSMSVGALCFNGYDESCGPDDPLSQAIDQAVNIGLVVVAIAGNDGDWPNAIVSTGSARRAITVGATYKKDYNDFVFNCEPGTSGLCGPCNESGQAFCNYGGDSNPSQDQITIFSSRGPVIYNEEIISKPDVVAPGAYICAARYDSIFPEGEHPYYHPCLDESHIQISGTSMATPIVSGIVALIKQAHPDWSPYQIKQSLKYTAIDLGYDEYSQGRGRVDALAAISYDPFVCGDVNADREPNALDLGYLIDYLFVGGIEPVPIESGDINGDGQIDALDLAWLIDILFAGAENPNGCGNVDMSGAPTPNPTEEEKQQAQQILDDAGINIQI